MAMDVAVQTAEIAGKNHLKVRKHHLKKKHSTASWLDWYSNWTEEEWAAEAHQYHPEHSKESWLEHYRTWTDQECAEWASGEKDDLM